MSTSVEYSLKCCFYCTIKFDLCERYKSLEGKKITLFHMAMVGIVGIVGMVVIVGIVGMVGMVSMVAMVGIVGMVDLTPYAYLLGILRLLNISY